MNSEEFILKHNEMVIKIIKECDYMIRNRFYLNETGIKNTATRIRDIAQFYIEEPEWKEEIRLWKKI